MRTLSEMVETELEEAGFSKEAVNPFTTRDRDRPTIQHTGNEDLDGVLPTGAATNDLQNDFEKERGRDHKSSPAVRNHSVVNKVAAAHEMARRLPMKQILQALVEKQASAACGLNSRSECLQTFTGSDVINRIKLAALSDMALKHLPAEWMLPLVRRLKGGTMIPGQYMDDLEALIMGRGLRGAAETGNVAKARTLFEGAGGAPVIDPEVLAGLQSKAEALDKYIQDPMERYLSGLQTGGLAGLGAGLLAPRLLNQGDQS